MTQPASLAASHDVLLIDLDGTLRLAGQPIPHAAASLKEAATRGASAVIVTNNPSKSPEQVADSLSAMGFSVTSDNVVTSAQVAAAMLAESHPPATRVLVLGTDALSDAVAGAGLAPVRSADVEPAAVVQGHSPDTCWGDLAEACIAIRSGADWVATNTDPTLPTDRGLLPGNGSMVQALVTATGRQPRVAGKPGRELLDAALTRARAERPLVVGDRLDTDVAAAIAAGMPSLFVLTGVSTAADLLAAPPHCRPTWVAADLRALVDPAAAGALNAAGGAGNLAGAAPPAGDPQGTAQPAATAHAAGARWAVAVTGDRLELRATVAAAGPGATNPPGSDGAIDALVALTTAAWRTGVTRVHAGDRSASAVLDRLQLT